jgi:hypothetical protein
MREPLELAQRRGGLCARVHEPVALVALQQLGRPCALGAAARDGEQERLEIARREPLCEQVGDAGDAEPALDSPQDVVFDAGHAKSLETAPVARLALR